MKATSSTLDRHYNDKNWSPIFCYHHRYYCIIFNKIVFLQKKRKMNNITLKLNIPFFISLHVGAHFLLWNNFTCCPATCKTKNLLKSPQCSLKVPSSCLGQEDFSVMQVSFHFDLPMSTGNGLGKLSANWVNTKVKQDLPKASKIWELLLWRASWNSSFFKPCLFHVKKTLGYML